MLLFNHLNTYDLMAIQVDLHQNYELVLSYTDQPPVLCNNPALIGSNLSFENLITKYRC